MFGLYIGLARGSQFICVSYLGLKKDVEDMFCLQTGWWALRTRVKHCPVAIVFPATWCFFVHKYIFFIKMDR